MRGATALEARYPTGDRDLHNVHTSDVHTSGARDRPGHGSGCPHSRRCPPASARDRQAAATVAAHPEQGWSRLCNGLILFDDGGEIRPGPAATPPA